MTATAVVVLAIIATVAGVFLALFAGGDRLVPCNQLRGLDALISGHIGHVDGPPRGGGCIVPTTGAWTTAVIAAVAPTAVVVAVLTRRRRTPRGDIGRG